MSLLDLIPAQYRLAAELLIVVALVSAGATALHLYGEHRYEAGKAEEHVLRENDRLRMEKALADQKTEAAQTLAKETEKTRAAEERLVALHNAQEHTDANNQAVVDRLQRSLAAVRLRDPFAKPEAAGRGCGRSGAEGQAATPAGDRAADAAEAPGLLSEGFTRLLRDRALESDTINDAYASCRSTAIGDRAAEAP